MAFAEPLESNAGLKKLQSAALPLNPLAMHIESTPLPTTSPHPALTAATPSIAPRVGGVTCLHLPVSGWLPTTSATRPCGPSKRPPAPASNWNSARVRPYGVVELRHPCRRRRRTLDPVVVEVRRQCRRRRATLDDIARCVDEVIGRTWRNRAPCVLTFTTLRAKSARSRVFPPPKEFFWARRAERAAARPGTKPPCSETLARRNARRGQRPQ